MFNQPKCGSRLAAWVRRDVCQGARRSSCAAVMQAAFNLSARCLLAFCQFLTRRGRFSIGGASELTCVKQSRATDRTPWHLFQTPLSAELPHACHEL